MSNKRLFVVQTKINLNNLASIPEGSIALVYDEDLIYEYKDENWNEIGSFSEADLEELKELIVAADNTANEAKTIANKTEATLQAFLTGVGDSTEIIDTLIEIQEYINSDTKAFISIGNEITTEKNKLNNITNQFQTLNASIINDIYDIKAMLDWSIGAFSTSGSVGAESANPTSIRTPLIYTLTDLVCLKNDDRIRMDIFWYDSDGNYQNMSKIRAGTKEVIEANSYFRIALRTNSAHPNQGEVTNPIATDIFNSEQYLGWSIYNKEKYYSLVPKYWITTLDEKAEIINNTIRQALSTNSYIGAFFVKTDSHYPSNAEVSPRLMKYLQDKCGISLCLDLGDLIDDTVGTYQNNIKVLNMSIQDILKGSDRFLFSQGNHDTGNQNTSKQPLSPERYIYETEWKAHTISKIINNNNIVFYKNGKAFYYDDPILKIRFISIDAFENNGYYGEKFRLDQKITQDQIDWIKNIALKNIPNDYLVVSFSHYSLFKFEFNDGTIYERGYLYQYAEGDSQALQADLQSAFASFKYNGGKYVGHFSGHIHCDLLQTKEISIDPNNVDAATESITNIWTMNDGIAGYNNSNYEEFIPKTGNKIKGTTDECAFDVVILTEETKNVDGVEQTIGKGEIIRIGRETLVDEAKPFTKRTWNY